jgi:4-amino-4-deoxy-L-arabinose transferase-like glycosyltransferase
VRESRARLALLPAIVILGAAVRLWGIDFGLPHPMARPDEEFILSVALRFFSGDFNPHFFEWPSFYFYIVHGVLRVAYLAGGYHDPSAFAHAITTDPSTAHLVLRFMSVISGIATLLVLHSLAKFLFDRTTALCATAFLAVANLHVRDSHFGVLDVPLTLLIVSAVRLLASAWHDGRMRSWVGAGVCAGLATSVKYNAGALLVPAIGAAALGVISSKPNVRQRALAGVLTFLAVSSVCFVAGSPYVLLDLAAFKEGLDAQVVRLTEGHGIRVAQVWLRHVTFSLWYGLGVPVLVAALAGAVLLVLQDWRRAVFLLSFPASYFLVVGSGHTAFIRYTTPLVPFFCLCAGYAVRQLVEGLARSLSMRSRQFALAAVVVLCAAPTCLTVVRFDRLLTRRDTRLIAADWLAAHMKAGESLYESGASYARPHYAWRHRSVDYVPLELEPARGVFVTAAGLDAVPDWIVVAESPLRLYTGVTPELRSIVNRHYKLVETVEPTTDVETEASFDRQDAFFLPYADFSSRVRPGPRLSIYRLSSSR